MSKFANQTSDAAQKFGPGAVSRDNDLKVNGRGSIPDIASEDPRDQSGQKRAKAAELRTSRVPGGNG